jgi:hypothetical protein
MICVACNGNKYGPNSASICTCCNSASSKLLPSCPPFSPSPENPVVQQDGKVLLLIPNAHQELMEWDVSLVIVRMGPHVTI